MPKSLDIAIAPEIKETYWQLAVKLEVLFFNYRMHKTQKIISLKDLNKLAGALAQKEGFREEFQIVDER